MGFVRTKVRISNPADRNRRLEVDVLVDTGALFSIVPRTILESIGITPTHRRTFRMANGDKMERDVATAIYEWGEYEGGAPVIFGEPGDATVLGVISLEALGLEVDPAKGELREMELLIV